MRSIRVFATSAVVRAGLQSIVERSGLFTVEGSTGTLTELLEDADERQREVVLADLGSGDPDLPGEVLAGLQPAVFLSDDGFPVSLGGRPGGGVAVLPRDADDEEIIGALMAVAAGLVVMHPRQEIAVPASVGRGGQSAPGQVEALTGREIEVLGMMAEGLANKTIARRLSISEHTVKFHVGSILGKLDAESRTEAVTLGLRRGLITV